MRFDPEASWGANAGLEIPRKALENVKVTVVYCFSLIMPTGADVFTLEHAEKKTDVGSFGAIFCV